MWLLKIKKFLYFYIVTFILAVGSPVAFGAEASQPAQPAEKPAVTATPAAPATAAQASQPSAPNAAKTDTAKAAAPTFFTIAQVVWVKGIMKATGMDKKERVLKRGDFIYDKDTIMTAPEGTGQLVFTDGSLVSFRENTTYRIQEYKYDKSAKPTDNKYVANLVKGGFRTITGAISKGHPENYQVSTPVATIGVRGTNYSVFCGMVCNYKLMVGEILIKNGFGALVLNTEIRFGEVPSGNVAPEALTSEPDVFLKDPPLENVAVPKSLLKLMNVAVPGPGGPGGSKGGPGGFSEGPGGSSKGPSGPASGFCIQ